MGPIRSLRRFGESEESEICAAAGRARLSRPRALTFTPYHGGCLSRRQFSPTHRTEQAQHHPTPPPSSSRALEMSHSKCDCRKQPGQNRLVLFKYSDPSREGRLPNVASNAGSRKGRCCRAVLVAARSKRASYNGEPSEAVLLRVGRPVIKTKRTTERNQLVGQIAGELAFWLLG